MAALPAHAVIQYDHALTKPTPLPNCVRAYAYGPPSAGIRRASPAKTMARARAPTLAMTSATRLIGPYDASAYGRLKMPTPTMLPTTSAVACQGPIFWLTSFLAGAADRRCAVMDMAHSFARCCCHRPARRRLASECEVTARGALGPIGPDQLTVSWGCRRSPRRGPAVHEYS